MEVISFLMPFLTAFYMLLVYGDELPWWAYIVVLVVTVLLVIFLRWRFMKHNMRDVEFVGSYVKGVYYYEPWNEWIVDIRQEERPCGTDSDGRTIYKTVTVDYSHEEYHPERWTMLDSYKGEITISYSYYEHLCSVWGTPRQFINMCRDYYTLDGDAYYSPWDMEEEHCVTHTHARRYDNRIQSSHSIFKYGNIGKKEAVDMGLYDYPDIQYGEQQPVLGLEVPDEQLKSVKFTNGYYGLQYSFRLFVLFFKGKDYEVSEQQRAYWEGGNRNELVVCLGLDGDDKVRWCNAFSWSDNQMLNLAVRNYFLEHKDVDLKAFCLWLRPQLPTMWKPKNFDNDFKYVSIPLTIAQQVSLLVFSIGASIGILAIILSLI